MRKFFRDTMYRTFICFLWMIIFLLGALVVFSIIIPMILIFTTNNPIWCLSFFICPFMMGLFSTVTFEILDRLYRTDFKTAQNLEEVK